MSFHIGNRTGQALDGGVGRRPALLACDSRSHIEASWQPREPPRSPRRRPHSRKKGADAKKMRPWQWLISIISFLRGTEKMQRNRKAD